VPPYLLAKIYAWRGSLLSLSTLQELASLRDLSELVTALKATHYNKVLAELQPPYTAIQLEHALRRRVVWIHHRISTLKPKERVVSALYLRYIARNIKVILRGLYSQQDTREISRLVDPYAEELAGARDLTARLLAAESLEEAINTLGLYYSDLRDFRLYREAGELAALDSDIDRWLYRRIQAAVLKTPRSYRREMTRLLQPTFYGLALETVLRGKIWGLDPRLVRSLVEGLVDPMFGVVLTVASDCRTPAELRSALAVMSRDLVPAIPEATSFEEVVRFLERGYRTMRLGRARRIFLSPFRDELLSVALLILLEEELATVTGIASGIEQGVSPEILQETIGSV
jgi:V/A-type H+-transporting ATPase subunit C